MSVCPAIPVEDSFLVGFNAISAVIELGDGSERRDDPSLRCSKKQTEGGSHPTLAPKPISSLIQTIRFDFSCPALTHFRHHLMYRTPCHSYEHPPALVLR